MHFRLRSHFTGTSHPLGPVNCAFSVSPVSGAEAMPGGEGRHEGESESGQGLPEQEGAAAEWAASGESSGEGPSAAAGAAMCLLDEGSQEGACGSGSSQENEQQPLESGHQGMGDSDGVPHTSMAACVPAPMQLNQQLGPLATAEAGECSPVYSPHHCRSKVSR